MIIEQYPPRKYAKDQYVSFYLDGRLEHGFVMKVLPDNKYLVTVKSRGQFVVHARVIN